MPVQHYTNYRNLGEALVAFCGFCRESGLKIGLSHVQEALDTAQEGFIADQSSLQYSLKSLFCVREEDFGIFDTCFNIFWRKSKHDYSHSINRNKTNLVKRSNASLVMMGFNPNASNDTVKDEASTVSGASRIETLKRTDFRMLANIDSRELDDIVEMLLRQLNHRLKRKMRPTKKGRIDLRRSIRTNLSNGDLIMELAYRNRKPEKFRLILLLDVSGSMDKYSFFLLRFIWSLKSQMKNIEAFVFSTRLVRITDFLHEREIEATLAELSEHANNWSGGTRIGDSLYEFNEKYSKRILNGKSVTIVLSDGLDDGDPENMSAQLKRIRMRTNKLVWLNPMKGNIGYEPIAKGMKAALPELDVFSSAHNLESLQELENILSDV